MFLSDMFLIDSVAGPVHIMDRRRGEERMSKSRESVKVISNRTLSWRSFPGIARCSMGLDTKYSTV